MYDYLEGRLTRRGAANLTLEVGGVGYHLLVPLGSGFPGPEESVRAWTHLAVRDDAHTLYGFDSRADRDFFRELLKVKGVGPAMALAVMSGLSRPELLRAILEEDVRRLTQVKGVGKKTAEQILLDLRDRAQSLTKGLDLGHGVIQPQAAPGGREENITDAVSALVALGFTDKDARKRVEAVSQSVDASDLNALVAAAFRPNP